MKYPPLQNFIGGRRRVPRRVRRGDLAARRHDLSRVPLSGAAEVDAAVRAAAAAFPAWSAETLRSGRRSPTPIASCSAATRRTRRADPRGERQDARRGPRRDRPGDRGDRVRLLAAATGVRRGAGGEPGRRVPRGARAARRGRVGHAVQLPRDGAALDDPDRHHARQHDGVQAVGEGSAHRGPHRRAARRGRVAARACSTSSTASGRWSRRCAITRT